MIRTTAVLLLAACRAPLPGCACPDGVEGHAVELEGACACLAAPAWTEDPEPSTVVWVDADGTGDGSRGEPAAEIPWPEVDAALADGDVEVRFDGADAWPDRIDVLRTDEGPHRLVLRGRGWRRDGADWVTDDAARATVPGIRTPLDGVPRHRITVRGFLVTGSRDKGIAWSTGDGIVVEDNIVVGNGGSPAVYLDYSSRVGRASDGFAVRGNRIGDQPGECVYIGGSEGADEDSHRGVIVEGNLVHDCRDPFGTRNDGINIKDRLVDVRVHRNVVLRADWGLEIASAGRYTHNLLVDTAREGVQVNDAFGPVRGLIVEDTVVIGAGHDGVHVSPSTGPADALQVRRLTVIDAGGAGVLVGGEHRVSLELADLAVLGTDVALDGWGDTDDAVRIDGCAAGPGVEAGAGRFEDRVSCTALPGGGDGPLAGTNGLLLDADDPWRVPGHGAEPVEE